MSRHRRRRCYKRRKAFLALIARGVQLTVNWPRSRGQWWPGKVIQINGHAMYIKRVHGSSVLVVCDA